VLFQHGHPRHNLDTPLTQSQTYLQTYGTVVSREGSASTPARWYSSECAVVRAGRCCGYISSISGSCD